MLLLPPLYRSIVAGGQYFPSRGDPNENLCFSAVVQPRVFPLADEPVSPVRSGTPLVAGQGNEDQHHAKVVGGYFEEWSIYFAGYNIANLQSNGVADKLTHLLYAFGNATPTGCAIADSWADYQSPYLPSVGGEPYSGPLYGNFAALQQLKQLHPNLKVLISLAGADGFSAAASTATGRQTFVAKCIDLFINGNLAPGISAEGVFDGFDIDWEFPTASDSANVTLLMQEFRKQLNALGKTNKKQYLLTMFGPAGQQNFSNIQLAEVAEELDFS
jgi:chitinase